MNVAIEDTQNSRKLSYVLYFYVSDRLSSYGKRFISIEIKEIEIVYSIYTTKAQGRYRGRGPPSI